MRNRLASALAVAVITFAACTPETGTDAHFAFTVAPLPPVAGAPMQLTFSTSHIGLVELYQGSEKLADVVNPRDDRNDLYVFVAKSAEVPRAVAYGGGGQRFEAVATRGVKGPPPPDASAPDGTVDAAPTFAEDCATATDLTASADAGTSCATFGGLLVNVRVVNRRPGGVEVFRDQWSPPTPPCSFTPLVNVGSVGVPVPLNLLDNGVLRFVDPTSGQVIRQVRIAQGAKCDLEIR